MKQIVFTDYNKAELLDVPFPELNDNEVLVKTIYSAISPGTEKANITGNTSMPGMRDRKPEKFFPRTLGYSCSGIVERVGKSVKEFNAGDRVSCIWSCHKEYQVLPENQVVHIPDNVDLLDAAFAFICTFPLAAVRKTDVEIGESAMVVGLGLLGQISVKLLNLSGAVPIIAVNRGEARRNIALKNGADYALNPNDAAFEEKVRTLTNNKGVSVMIEVTGNGDALNQGLRCMSKMGRVALLGCTRKPTEIDLYYDVHLPGVVLYGAHTWARPDLESYPHHWTHKDDCSAILNLISAGRLDIKSLIEKKYNPNDCPEIYKQLVNDKDFPVGAVFDWSTLTT